MIEMNLLAQFAAFADAGTLTRAAEQLHTSQPALTRAMKKLELELGVPLFVRSKNHLELTETGPLCRSLCQTGITGKSRFLQPRPQLRAQPSHPFHRLLRSGPADGADAHHQQPL